MSEGTRTGTTLGPYAIGRLLGRGGMGEVYLAHDEQRDRDVALKVLHASAAEDPQFRERFTRESQTVARLADPHVIPIHDFGEIDGVLYIDMRLVEGRNLAEILRGGALPPERAVTVVEQVAGALDAAHAKGLVHRDVKPANIEITDAGFPYLLDFGLAVTDTQTRMTSAGLFVGSQGYAAPERFDGDSATVAGDVYSLACVLFEALTGRPPYRGESLGAMLKQHLTAPIPRPSAEAPVPAAMDSVIAHGLAKDPAARFASCGELARAAREALAGRAAAAPSAGYADTMLRPAAAPDDATTISHPGPSYPDASLPTVAHPQTPFPQASYPQASHPPASYSQASYPQASYPMAPSYPAAPAYQQAPPKRSNLVPVLAVIATLLVVVTAVFGYVAWQNRDGATTAASTTHTRTATVSGEAPSGVSAAPATTTVPADPVAALQSRAATDRSAVLSGLNNRWVVQLSSKYTGVVDDGRTWLDADILGEVGYFDRRFSSVRLLNSNDWTVYDHNRQYWIAIYGGASWDTAEPALAWCLQQNFDRNHCAAKLISDTHPVEGSSRYNP